MIKVDYFLNRLGHLEINPVDKRRKRRCLNEIVQDHRECCPDLHRSYNKEETERWLRGHSCIYIQRDYDIEAALEGLPSRDRRSLEHGWEVRKLMELDEFEHYFYATNGIPTPY